MTKLFKTTTALVTLIAITASVGLVQAEGKTKPAANSDKEMKMDANFEKQLIEYDIQNIHSAFIENAIIQKLKNNQNKAEVQALLDDLFTLRGDYVELEDALTDEEYLDGKMDEFEDMMMDDETTMGELNDFFDDEMDEKEAEAEFKKIEEVLKKHDQDGSLRKQAESFVEKMMKFEGGKK